MHFYKMIVILLKEKEGQSTFVFITLRAVQLKPKHRLFRKALKRVNPIKAGDALWDFFFFGLEDMLEFLVMYRDKRFGSNDAGVGEVSGAVGQAVDSAKFKISSTLFFHYLFIDLNPFIRLHGSAFIQKPAVGFEPFRCIQNAEFSQPEVKIIYLSPFYEPYRFMASNFIPRCQTILVRFD